MTWYPVECRVACPTCGAWAYDMCSGPLRVCPERAALYRARLDEHATVDIPTPTGANP